MVDNLFRPFLIPLLSLLRTPLCLILLGKEVLTLESHPSVAYSSLPAFPQALPTCQGSIGLYLGPCLQRAGHRMLPTVLCFDEPL